MPNGHFILNYHPETDKVLVFEPKTVAVSEKKTNEIKAC